MMPRTGNACRRSTLGVALVALFSMPALPGVAAEPIPAFEACAATPTPQCVFGLAADAIAIGTGTDGDQLLAYVERPALLRLAVQTVVGLVEAGAGERAVAVVRNAASSAEERAAILLDAAGRAPALARTTAIRPLVEESLHLLDPFAGWPALTSASAAERRAALARWLAIVRLCEAAGVHDPALASVGTARRALATPAFGGLDEDSRTELALAVMRAALAIGDPAMAEDVSAKVSGSAAWSAARVEVAAGYARQDQTSPALQLISTFDMALKQPATVEIFKSFLRRKWPDLARSSLLSLTAPEQARALVEVVPSVAADNLLAVLNVVGSPVQSVARAALVQRLLRDGSYGQALQQATAIPEPWVRLNALAAVTTESALAGDGATTRDARYWLDSTRWIDVDPQEYFAAAFASAFSRVALGDLESSRRDLETLQARLEAIEQSGTMLAVPQGVDLLSLSLDGFRMAAGDEAEVLRPMGSSTPALFHQAFAAGTAFGMAGARADDVVAHALAAIGSVEDASLRVGLLLTLGHQMQTHRLVYGFGDSR